MREMTISPWRARVFIYSGVGVTGRLGDKEADGSVTNMLHFSFFFSFSILFLNRVMNLMILIFLAKLIILR